MLNDVVLPIYHRLTHLSRPFLSGRFWTIKTALLVTAISLFLAFPSYESLRAPSATWDAVLSKAEDLRYNVLQDHGESTNAARVNFRLTVPVVSRVLGLNMYGLVAFQFLCGVALFALSAQLADNLTGDRFTALCLTLAIAGTYAGTTSFLELRGIFDGVALFLVMCALSTRRWWAVALFVFLAAWTEERTLIVMPCVLAYYALTSERLGWRSLVTAPVAGVFLGITVYVGSYVLYANVFSIPVTYAGNGLYVLIGQINIFPMAIWTAFEGGWLIVAMGILCLIRMPQRMVATLVVLGLVAILIASVMVVDVSRTTAFALPALFVALAAIAKHYSASEVRQLTLAAAAVSLLWPMYYAGGQRSIWWSYPMPFQIVRWVLLSRGIALN